MLIIDSAAMMIQLGTIGGFVSTSAHIETASTWAFLRARRMGKPRWFVPTFHILLAND